MFETASGIDDHGFSDNVIRSFSNTLATNPRALHYWFLKTGWRCELGSCSWKLRYTLFNKWLFDWFLSVEGETYVDCWLMLMYEDTFFVSKDSRVGNWASNYKKKVFEWWRKVLVVFLSS
jgi:hypothetical protein